MLLTRLYKMNQLKEINAIQNINISDLVKKADYNTKIEIFEEKTPNHDIYNQYSQIE